MRSVMYRKIKISFLILTGFALYSCIHTDPHDCPVPKSVTVAVGDKNYDNISDVEGIVPVRTDSPFIFYLPQLFVWWSSADIPHTASIMIRQAGEVHLLTTDIFSKGENDVVVVGNERHAGKKLQPIYSNMLHENGHEGSDVYIGSSRLSMPLSDDIIITMKRAKGKLITRFINLPEEIRRIDIRIDGLYESVDGNMIYSGMAGVGKTFGSADLNGDMELFLAPSNSFTGSPVTIDLFDKAGGKKTLSNINVSIGRNRITLIKPVFDPETNLWEVSLLVDGEWETIHDLSIE